MSRWRPPRETGSKYITAEGAQKLSEELQHLWKVERRQVTKSVSEAAQQGDRSENAEYIYGKKRLREIDKRIRFLTKRLDELTVVKEVPKNQDKVYFGAFVTLEDDNGEEIEYRIVGSDEFDIPKGKISMESVLGKTLLGKSLDDEVTVSTPRGKSVFCIRGIRYEEK